MSPSTTAAAIPVTSKGGVMGQIKEALKGRWQVIAGCTFIPLVLICGLILFHRCTAFGKGLSVDGYATVGAILFAAAFGFGAVILETRSSYQQLRERLADQHRATEEEQTRKSRALAKALLFEIDNFYVLELDLPWKGIQNINPEKDDLPGRIPVRGNAFDVYRGNVAQLGLLSDKSVHDVARFYMLASFYLALVQTYNDCLDYMFKGTDPEFYEAISTPPTGTHARANTEAYEARRERM